jgi:chemotaxis signal transduction protein
VNPQRDAASLEQRLAVFFTAGGVRYAIRAVTVMEVGVPDRDGNTLRGHLGLRDLSQVLGGEVESEVPGTALVLDTSPTRALRVAQVEGVFDVSTLAALALPRRLIPQLSPAVRGTVVREGRLYFELETDALARGLPRQTRRPELFAHGDVGSALVFQSGGRRLGVPLGQVRQVVPRGPGFNRAPGQGAFLGAVAHRDLLLPVFSVTEAAAAEAFLVLVDVKGEGVGLSAAIVEGVKPQTDLAEVLVLDLERVFS